MPKRPPNKIDRELGQRIRNAREARGGTLGSLGMKIGVAHNAIAKYEKGQVPVTVSRLVSIARALDLPVREFIEGF